MMSKGHMRRYWLAAHLYIGLFLGGLFALLGLTGSLLVFYPELDRVLNPHTVPEHAVSTQKILPQAVLDKLREAYTERKMGWRIELPMKLGQPVMARYMKAVEKQHHHFAPLIVTLDPETLEITSSRFWGEFAMTWIYDLHYQLLLEGTGKTILAFVALFMMVSLASGVYLWWPRHGSFKTAFAIRKRAHLARKVYDWHKTAGLTGLIILLLLALTGLLLEKPTWFDPALAMPAPFFKPQKDQSIPNGKSPLSLDKIVSIAQQRFPNAEARWIYTPDDAHGAHQVRLYQSGEPSRRFPKTILWIDQYNGEILTVRDAKKDVFGDTVVAWLHPLHNGEVLGTGGRIVVFLSGLVCPLLFVTGVIRWLHKRKAEKFLVLRKEKLANKY